MPAFLFGQDTLSALQNMHSVSKGETWESIAALHGVSVLELRAANPDVKRKKPKKGTLLIIPAKPLPPEYVPVSEVPEKPARVVRNSISDMKVGVLLPFEDAKMVEFYRGFLMAADSVRKSGVNLDIHAWDCGTTTAQTEALLPQLAGFDLLVGPASATQIPVVAETCKEQGIRLVLPFWSGQPLLDYPLVYNATAPGSIFFDAAAKKMMSFFADKNYVVVHSGNADNHGRALTDALSQELAQRTGTARTLELEGDDFAYEAAFNQFRDNFVFLDNASPAVLDSLLSHLRAFREKHPQYKLSLIGFPEWQDEMERLKDDFSAFDTYFVTPYYYNQLDDRTRLFRRSYERNFRAHIIKNNPRFAAMGFDLGFFFLRGVSSLGDNFEQSQGDLQQQPYQNWYSFKRSSSGMSFVNSFVQFIHYTPDNRVEIIR